MIELESPIHKYLAQPENLESALDVAAQVEELVPTLHHLFWDAMDRKLTAWFETTPCGENWVLFLSGREERFGRHPKWGLRPKNAPIDLLRIEFEQSAVENGSHLFMGVNGNHSYRTDEWKHAFSGLQRQLQSQGYRSNNKWWIGILYLGYAVRSKRFLLRLVREEEKFVDELVEKFKNLVDDVLPEVERLNQLLITAHMQDS